MPGYIYSDDEELARALQAEYDSEVRQSQQNRQPQASNSRQATSFVRPPPTNPAVTRGVFVEPSPTSVEAISDEDIARSLGTEETKYNRRTPNTSRASSAGEDVEIARRIEQELKDEEFARRLEQAEEERLSQNQARSMATTPANRGCTTKRLCSYLVPIAVIAGVAVGLIYYFGVNTSSISNWIPNPNDIYKEDPFKGNITGPADANRWQNNGHGLQLEVLNALDDPWYPYFYQAVNEWDNGDPDALTLSTSVRMPDSNCSAVQGKMKVCNGDYGATNWRGINIVSLEGIYIIASIAMMNEHYFSGADTDQRQYTMCHEQGHGFGLPHTDENFYNKDLGNCMDYTIHPGVNKQPDLSNYEFLMALYGNVTSSTQTSGTTSTQSSLPQGTTQPNTNNRPGKGPNRSLQATTTDDVPLDPWLRDAWRKHIPRIMKRVDGREYEDGWTLLHRNQHGESHEMDLGGGFIIKVHKLLA